MYESYEEWFDIFREACSQIGYDGPFLRETWESDFEDEKCPYESAEEFVKEINE